MRLLLAAGSLSVVGLFALARQLTPSPTGFGTHEQLGLAPCWILTQTGVRCPSCGMTTAWAHLVRGNISAALQANLGGVLAGVAAAAAAPWLLASALAGRWLVAKPRLIWLLTSGSIWLGLVVIDWVRRFFTV